MFLRILYVFHLLLEFLLSMEDLTAMSTKSAEILLAAVIFSRSTSLLFSKIGMETFELFNLLSIRFCLAFILLVIIFIKPIKKTTSRDVFNGFIVGIVFFVVMSLETYALTLTETTTNSFLVNSAIVIVPIINAIIWHAPITKKTAISAVVTLIGVAFLTLRSGIHIGAGETVCIITAIIYAFSIILTGRLSQKGNPMLFGIYQVGFMGVFAVIGTFIFETPRMPETSTEWGAIAFLVLVCSCFGFTLQPLAQKYVDINRAGQFSAINPLSVAILGTVFLDERLGTFGWIGAALILTGIILGSFSKDTLILNKMKHKHSIQK